jgi:hypothetical protein
MLFDGQYHVGIGIGFIQRQRLLGCRSSAGFIER